MLQPGGRQGSAIKKTEKNKAGFWGVLPCTGDRESWTVGLCGVPRVSTPTLLGVPGRCCVP